jgi:hypothetical protein
LDTKDSADRSPMLTIVSTVGADYFCFLATLPNFPFQYFSSSRGVRGRRGRRVLGDIQEYRIVQKVKS